MVTIKEMAQELGVSTTTVSMLSWQDKRSFTG